MQQIGEEKKKTHNKKNPLMIYICYHVFVHFFFLKTWKALIDE